MTSIRYYLECLLQIFLNQLRMIRNRKWMVILVVLLLTCFLMIGLKFQEELSEMAEQEEINEYMAWWGMVCENATRGLRESRTGRTGVTLPLCSCVERYPVFYDGLLDLETMSKNRTKALIQAVKVYQEEVDVGGHWKPSDCVARQRVAIVIPYRNRQEHLKVFASYMHPFLQKQSIEYQIFIVEQAAPEIFNRASLMNIGFLEALKLQDFDCFVFHDVDLIPLDPRNSYTCYRSPMHLGAYMNKFEYEMPYFKFFGGAVALSRENMHQMNGFSNRYYGWGGEDDDTYNRVLWRNWTIHRHIQPIGKSFMIKHEEDEGNPKNPKRDIGYELQPEQYVSNGINSVIYTAHQVDLLPLYTRLLVSIEKEYLAECIVDPDKPPTADGNYVDCLTEDHFDAKDVDCCRYDNNDVHCCNKGYGYDMYVALEPGRRGFLFIVIAAVGLVCGILSLISWKRPQWLTKLYDRCPEKVQKLLDKLPKETLKNVLPTNWQFRPFDLSIVRTNIQRFCTRR